jgi:ABC-2 type transport system ATP-binding protein
VPGILSKEEGRLNVLDVFPPDGLAIEVRNLTKRYEKLVAVDHVSFEVRTREIFGFLGPNGAGKTTTVRMLTGVIRADEGQATILGYKVGSLEAKQVTGVVPEMANAYNDLSGWNNLMLMAELYDVPARTAQDKGTKLLQELGLFERKDSLVKGYSKGMKQRLILAMALISDPEILFLDEPTSGLDVQSARLIKSLIQALNAGGKTIFLTTHDMDEANQLCDRVAVINKGKIVAIDAPERLRMATSGRHSVEVSFTENINPETLAQLPGVNEVRKVGDKYRLYTESPGELVVGLVDYSRTIRLKIVSLNILAPSLEDAFVALTEKEGKHA